MDSKISIIVPVYNVEKYIEQCIESIINQTYKNLDIILIDDGSTDKSGEICDRYAEKDSRIRVIHQENKGIGETRNEGLKYVTGEYIGWVDSDDIIDKNMYEVLYKNMIESDASISCCGFTKIESINDINDSIIGDNIYKVKNEDNVIGMIRGSFSCFLWNKLFKKELFEDITFVNQKVSEDYIALIDVVCKKPKVVETEASYYFYRIRKNSAMNNDSLEGKKDILKGSFLVLNKLREKKYDDKKWMNYSIMYGNVLVYNQIKHLHTDEVKNLRKDIRKGILKVIFKLPRGMNKKEQRECLYAIAILLRLK